jgi:translation elongation factor EF-1beta
MKELEANMRQISMDGLTWGASKLVPVGYGISKLQVNLVSFRALSFTRLAHLLVLGSGR